MTVLQLTGGTEIRVPMTYEEIRELLETAIAQGKLLELARSDGATVLVNPNNVDYISNTSDRGPGPARDQELDEAPA
ncbi:MAG: hypothetical protein H0V12_06275 [Chloroflexi bacterium]|jgi:hypothetical protein|nr:hypothetical protein [Chloroflexota bacterium]